MTFVALGMNILLATLLIAALALGVRLDRKLKGVRDGQGAFVLAVHELNAAASKAQAALADLRAATDEATDNLGGRIARAREASERLERLLSRAETAPVARGASVREGPAREGPEAGLAALLGAMKEAETAPSISRLLRTPGAVARAARPIARSAFDDDLFDEEGRS